MRALRLPLLLLLALPSLAWAQDKIVSSDVVSDVAVTIYRDPYRDAGMMNANWPGGYALITETRTISLPQGDSVIRFENVAEGLLPETAIITGLPKGVREKNRDARLISPAGLVDAYLKRRVMIRRTDPATGKVREESAVIQSGPDGGVLLRTDRGVEALRCSGLPERMIYDGVPEGLSAKPTLSIRTRSDRAMSAVIQLTYMAQGFDWAANYIGTVPPEGGKMALFAWLTVANGGQQSFKDARLQVIAGKPNKRPNNPPPPPPSTWLNLQCWPADVTSTAPREEFVPIPLPPGNDLSQFNAVGRNAPGSFETRKQRKLRLKREREGSYAFEGDDSAIVVTGTASGGGRGGFSVRRSKPQSMSIMSADMAMPSPPPPPPPPPPVAVSALDVVEIAQGAKAGVEDLGDLKLYRVPMRVLVAAQSQKQVAMLSQPAAKFDRVYTAQFYAGGINPRPLTLTLRATNTKESGLGLPLPSGSLALFETVAGRQLLAGENAVADKAIGEEVEISIGNSPDVQWTLTRVSETDRKQGWRAEISNARDVPVSVEVIVPEDVVRKPSGAVRRGIGWAVPVLVPANDRAVVSYVLKSEGGI